MCWVPAFIAAHEDQFESFYQRAIGGYRGVLVGHDIPIAAIEAVPSTVFKVTPEEVAWRYLEDRELLSRVGATTNLLEGSVCFAKSGENDLSHDFSHRFYVKGTNEVYCCVVVVGFGS